MNNNLQQCYLELKSVTSPIICKSVRDACRIINVNSTFNALESYRQRLLSFQKKDTIFFPANAVTREESALNKELVTQQQANTGTGNRQSCCVSTGNCQYFSIHDLADVTSAGYVSENRKENNITSLRIGDKETNIKQNSFVLEEGKRCEKSSEDAGTKNTKESSNLSEPSAAPKVTSNEKKSPALSKKTEKLNNSDDRPYRCSNCNKAFKRNLHLKRHFLVTHTESKNFNCDICGRSFSRKDYLDKHIGGHEKKNFKLKLLQQGIVVRTKMSVKTKDDGS